MDHETKEQFVHMNKQMNERFDAMDERFDGLVKYMEAGFRDIKMELSMIRRDLEEVKERLAVLEKRLFDNETIMAKDVLELRGRITRLEAQVRELQAHPA